MGQRMPCKCIIYLPNYIITCLLTSLFLSCETSDFCILQHFIINQLQLKPFSFFFCTQNYFNMAEFQDELKSQGVGSRGGWCAWGPFNSQGSILQILFSLPQMHLPIIFFPTFFYAVDLHLHFKFQIKCYFLFKVLNSQGRVSVPLFFVQIAFCSYLYCIYSVVLQLYVCFFQ